MLRKKPRLFYEARFCLSYSTFRAKDFPYFFVSLEIV